jgi:hypothetical protein
LVALLGVAQFVAQGRQLRRLHVAHVLQMLHHLGRIVRREIATQHGRRAPKRALDLA